MSIWFDGVLALMFRDGFVILFLNIEQIQCFLFDFQIL